MKNKKHKVLTEENNNIDICRTPQPPPPWFRAKNKQDAYHKGIVQGYDEGRNACKGEIEDMKEKAKSNATGARLQALTNCTQALECVCRLVINLEKSL